MRPKHFVTLLVLPAVLLAALLTLAAPAAPAHAGGVVTVCDEAHLRTALAGGGTVTFSCSGTITLTATIWIAADTTIDGSGQSVTVSGNHRVVVFSAGRSLNLNALTVADGFTHWSRRRHPQRRHADREQQHLLRQSRLPIRRRRI